MSSNWLRRQIAKIAPKSHRRVRRSIDISVSLDIRVLLSAALSGHEEHLESGHDDHTYCEFPKWNEQAAAALAASPQGAPLFALTETFKLHSNRGASKVIYLDFDGQVVTGTAWNSNGNTLTFDPYSFEGGATFSNNELEQMQRIWARVAEDFAPFNVDVTTEEPPLADLMNTGGGDTRWGIRVLMSGNDPLNSGAGGIAFIGSFSWDSDTPALVFNIGEKGAAEAATHEVGHSLGVVHDGRTTPQEEYYGGHGTGEVSWGPVMGASYGPNLVQWSQGEYLNANNQEDDIKIITTQNGFGFRADDFANTRSGAAKAQAVKNGVNFDVNQFGIIEQRTDVDFFRIDVGNGLVTLNAFGAGGVDSNLDILMEVYNANGQLVTSSNPDDKLSASVTFNATLGPYYVKIDGVGRGDPKGDGYTDYGSLGQYRIQGSYPDPGNSPPIINDQTLPAVMENATVGTVVGTPVALDPNNNQVLKYEIIGGNTGGAFAINQSTGLITVANPSAIDFEINQSFDLIVRVTDNGTPPLSDTGIVHIDVRDITTWSLSGSVLTVKGTALNDKIKVFAESGIVKIDDGLSVQNTNINVSSLTAINLLGLLGDDNLRLDASLGATTSNSILGGKGNDVLISSLGKDVLDGGDGIDQASYIQAPTAVTVSLAITGPQNTGGAGIDTLLAIENLNGSNFADRLNGNGAANTLDGGAANDTINGGDGDDTLIGGAGADSLSGEVGNDTLVFDTADTTVSGGVGTDTARLINQTAAVSLNLLAGSIEIVDASASTFNNKFDATGATWSVTITGGNGNDTILGGSGNDLLEGGVGNDSITGAGGNDTVRGGHGNDILLIDHLDSVVDAGQGLDKVVLQGATAAVNINLFAGQIEELDVSSSTFNNTLNAGSAPWNVKITGGSGNDTITGGSGVDTLLGGNGNDVIVGGLGNDSIEGGAGADSLDAGGGNDTIIFDNLDTKILGGDGTDTAISKGTTGAVNINVFAAKLETIDLSGSSSNNTLDASGVSWIVNLTGGSGNDTIKGGSANDKLTGGSGNDLIDGGKGNDVLDGGFGVDTVTYASASGSVTVNLTTGTANGAAGADILKNFENLTGSTFNDTLIGTTGANVIHGGGGLNIIDGKGGADSILNP